MIQLRSITWENFNECIGLSVTSEQEDYVASNEYSIAQSYVSLLNDEFPQMSYAIYNDDTLVGYTLMYFETGEENDYSDEDCYGICRFMIDQNHQGKGYGREAMQRALEYLKTLPHGEAHWIYLTYEPKNEVAKKLYASFGFVETGQVINGEVVARLSI